MDKRALGTSGEKIAGEYLIKHGYTILDKNYRKRVGEIDLIAQDPNSKELVFVEVKLRRTLAFGHPEEAITAEKWKKLVQVCQHWLQESKGHYPSWRIDLIAIYMEKDRININHIKHIGM